MVEDSGYVNRAELLRVALEPAAGNREVFGHPNGYAARIGDTVFLATHHNKRLEVLRSNRVEKFCAALAARLPVGPNDGNSTRMLVSQFEVGWQDCAHIGHVG